MEPLLDTSDFSKSKPVLPTPEDIPDPPNIESGMYKPQLGFLDRFVPSKRKQE